MMEIPTRYKKTLKNFSPMAFEVKPIEWSISDNEEIDNLKSLFLFKRGFDLHSHLANIPVDIRTFMEIDRQKPTEKETIGYLKKTKSKASQLISCLQKEKSLLTLPTKDKMSELKHLFEIMGPHHIKLLSTHIPGSFTAINEFRNAFDLLCDDDFLSKLIINLQGLLQGVEISQATIPSPKVGRKEVNLEVGIIHKLVHIYTAGTELEAKCNWHPIQDQYIGEFYEFLLNVIDLIKKHTPIKPLNRNTWGIYAKEAIRYHYKKDEYTEE